MLWCRWSQFTRRTLPALLAVAPTRRELSQLLTHCTTTSRTAISRISLYHAHENGRDKTSHLDGHVKLYKEECDSAAMQLPTFPQTKPCVLASWFRSRPGSLKQDKQKSQHLPLSLLFLIPRTTGGLTLPVGVVTLLMLLSNGNIPGSNLRQCWRLWAW